jgi:two-component sensor histidine kinase
MRLGYELVKEQLFFQKELIERACWFIRLRWLAVGVALLGSWAAFFFEPRFPVFPLTFIALSILLYNVVFHLVWHRIHSRVPLDVKSFEIFAHVQISMDLIALYGIVCCTGGIHSPLLIFVIFHIILAGILLSPLSCYVYGVMVAVVTGFLLGLQEWALFPPLPVLFQSSLFPGGAEFPQLAVHYGVFVAAILITAFLTTSLKGTLRTKGRELLHVSKDLEASNAKLTALYDMLKRIGLSSDLQELMDLATRNAARIMGVKACSIKLLDEDRKRLNFASAYGLSLDYMAKGSIEVNKSPINRKVIEGSFFSIGKIDEKDYFQYPEDIRKEGIASMVCLPLRVEKMAIGVLCVYSDVSYYFDEEDIRFFSLMSDLIALAIETLRSEINKTWFLRKAAHQLRSPFTAMYSMLKVLAAGYLGPMSKEQKEMVLRCIKRIEMLGDLINDLLKLGIKRVEADKASIHPVDGGSILTGLATLFQTQAQERQVEVTFTVEEDLPQIMGDERLLDELFTNLISNAVKYTPSGGSVRVWLSRVDQNRVRLEVEDTGIGVPEEDQHRLFTEFFRAENAKSLVEEGTGLGLVIVKEILDHLGGTISFESKVGQGTRIRCLLPAI